MTKPGNAPTFEEILEARYSRRGALGTMVKTAATTVALTSGGAALTACSDGSDRTKTAGLTFREIPHIYDATHHVADGYDARILVRWGDQIIPGQSHPFRPGVMTEKDQAAQFGYNNDFIAYAPLPAGSDSSDHGLLVVNHEFPDAAFMFAGYEEGNPAVNISFADARVEMQAVGLSVVEIRKRHNQWTYVSDSRFNRRITASSKMEITGPAAGHKRMQTAADPTGKQALGTLFNCAGGVTPWGTVLSAEENFNLFFWGNQAEAERLEPDELRNLREFNIGYYSKLDDAGNAAATDKEPRMVGWYQHDPRFDIGQNPTEPNRFGWLVEFDPYSPRVAPKKRTALGRFKHEGAGVFARHKKPVVIYSGDDERFQYVYKFVSRNAYRRGNDRSNFDLLEEGDLFVAQFFPDGRGRWVKLELDKDGVVERETGLKSQADVLIEARAVARALGATPMDRPEDIEVDPVSQRVYLTLTENKKLRPDQANAANPRANNYWGHIVEIVPPGKDGDRDHWSDEFEWDILLLAGDPGHLNSAMRGVYHPDLSDSGWFQNPDNIAFDPQGRMWIASDGFPSHRTMDGQPAPVHDGLWACETTGPRRALTKHFFGCPRGAEMCGPCFTPDGKTLFVAVQHPGREPGFHFASPATRWPDFQEGVPPRPSVLAITKKDGGLIGS